MLTATMRRLAAALPVALLLGLLAPTGAAHAATEAIDGPDVSSHQHPNGAGIDWSRVAGSGRADFAFVKATEGQTYTNPYFSSDYTSLESLGVVRGAYHFARPSGGATNARAQARHFVAVAGTESGTDELPAVLDLETSGGLGPKALISWTHAYVDAIKRLTGRWPILYTYPSFWRTAMADTTQFDGLPLWIATYASRPELVGGWTHYTFWQYTSRASLPGISTAVDMSVFAGSDADLEALANVRPSAPASVSAAVSGTSVAVTWTPPTGGGTPTGYVVRVDGKDVTQLGATARRYVVHNLAPGRHRFAVAALNAAGTGSARVTSATVVVLPAAPTDLQLTVAGTSVTADWAAPAQPAGQLSGYRVSIDGSAPVTVPATTTSHTFTDLASGPHQVSVSAYNRVGTGPAATGSATVIVKPSAPTDLETSIGPASVTLSWSPPLDPGGQLSGYLVQIDDQTPVQVPSTQTSFTASGLAPGDHRVAVAAYNSAGTSRQVATDALVVVKPGSPTHLKASARLGTATLTWTAPTDTGGHIAGYLVWVDGGTARKVPADTTRYTVTGLAAGTHALEVAAYNAAGSSRPADASVTVVLPPSPPTGLAATETDGAWRLTWSPPARPGGTVTGYQVFVDGRPVATLRAGARSYTVTGLGAGRHRLAVAAVDSAGVGRRARVVAAVLPTPQLTLTASATSVAPNRLVTLAGHTARAWAGETIRLQVWRDDAWVRAGRASVAADGSYRFGLRPDRTSRYRVHLPGTDRHLPATSPSVRVAVH